MADEEVEEIYLQLKEEVLKDLRPFLVQNLECQKLFAFLRSREVLDVDDQEEIEAEKIRRRRNERLLDIVKSRGSDGFDNFCEAIRQNKTQIFILKAILDSFQKKLDNCSDISLFNGNGSNELTEAQLPVPGGPGGPAVPYFEIPEEYITTTNGEIRGRRARSPPPVYTES
ncbi:uncharacterized protein LOC135693544 [Rhopilema esculentum]|uniref:uncharacterized protein LOC135693544 n=1 Tax=Rhopilema esculentum TaxID=499914 RepID=UPI0031D05913|eukprot:gene10775-19568_t